MKQPASLKARIARGILRLFGWQVERELPAAPKYVAIGYPHTSNWDFPVGILTMWALGIRGRWVGKHTLFRWPFGWVMRALGGLPLDRERTRDFVQQSVEAFARREELILVLAPEGTRSRTEGWRTGFYYIALGAAVPIALGYLDFGRRRAGIGAVLVPSGDLEADFERLRAFYRNRSGRRPERQSEIRPRPKAA
ncbi:MAG: lysophospholipid acyltransferase family protein [Gemmatimonadota bacterium]